MYDAAIEQFDAKSKRKIILSDEMEMGNVKQFIFFFQMFVTVVLNRCLHVFFFLSRFKFHLLLVLPRGKRKLFNPFSDCVRFKPIKYRFEIDVNDVTNHCHNKNQNPCALSA